MQHQEYGVVVMAAIVGGLGTLVHLSERDEIRASDRPLREGVAS